MDNDFAALGRYLRLWDQQRRRQETLMWLPRALLIALGIALAAAGLSHLRPWLTRNETGLLALSLVLIAAAVTLLIFAVLRRPLPDQARFADRQFALRERTATAVQIQTGQVQTTPDMAEAQLRDALASAAAVDYKAHLPLKFNLSQWAPVLIALVLLGVALWLPNRQELLLLEQRAIAATVAEQTTALEALSESIAANENLTADQQAQLQQPLQEALETLNNPGVSQEEAVAALSGAEAELRDLSSQFNNQSLSEALAQSAAALSQSEAAAELGQSLQNNNLTEAGAAAASLAEELANLDHGSQQELAESLREAAATLENSNGELAEQLANAAAALAEGDTEAAADAMQAAANSLNQAAQQQAAAEQAQQAAESLASARESVAQSGAQPTAQSGQSEEGQTAEANGTSNGSGQGQTEGETAAQSGSQGQQPGSGGISQGGGHMENVFVPSSIDLSTFEGVDLELQVQCLINPEACGPPGEQLPTGETPPTTSGSLVPYQQVLGLYQATANEALSQGNIPIGLQDLVRQYFSSLEP